MRSMILFLVLPLVLPCIASENQAEEGVLLQMRQAGAAQRQLQRISVSSDGTLVRGDQRVVPLGGNYVMKAQPYFPPLNVVRANAKSMARSARKMQYQPSDGRKVVPVVRLGTLFEAAMPERAGAIDSAWAKTLDDVLDAFAAEGVYAFLDVHQDAFSTTNGGEGFPFWIAQHMQATARRGGPYIASPWYPLETVICDFLVQVAAGLGIDVPTVRTEPGDTDPWRNYSLGSKAGNPRFMNVGNRNMRLNNNDEAWSAGILGITKQVQNYGLRLYSSPGEWRNGDDAHIFAPYVAFVEFLCRVWERHPNVIAVELMNEPPIAGLPSIWAAVGSRRKLFDFYAAVLRRLERASPPVRTPIAIEDFLGSAEGANPLLNILFAQPLSLPTLARLRSWAKRGQLLFSFHFYPGLATTVDLPQMIQLARAAAAKLGSKTIFFSEYFTETRQSTADILAEATELGCDAVTYWHYVDTSYTETEGWYIYPPSVTNEGPLIEGAEVNPEAWEAYAPTVADSSFWGAEITGANGGKADVLELVPKQPQARKGGMAKPGTLKGGVERAPTASQSVGV